MFEKISPASGESCHAAREPVRTRRREQMFLAGVMVLLLAGWLDRPLHVDDPLFVWTAQHLEHDPLDFYNFDVNWYGQDEPMYLITQNPPLASYYLLPFGAFSGWRVAVLHFAMWLPALAAVLGCYRLAGRFCDRPLWAALAFVLTPAMLVSSTTLMSDVPMLALWIWALDFWIAGCEPICLRRLFVGAFLAGLAALTKYFGVCLLPLMAAYGLLTWQKHRRVGLPIAALLVPVLMLVAYESATRWWYGAGLLSSAFGYASHWAGHPRDWPSQVTVALSMLGGCVPSVLFVAWLLVGRMQLIVVAMAVAAGAIGGAWGAGAFWPSTADLPIAPAALGIQLGCFAAVGIATLALALVDVLRARDAQSVFLLLWVLGTFAFAGFVNWTSNARSVLPLAPAVGILIARRLQEHKVGDVPLFSWLAAAALTLLVTWADYQHAGAVRSAAGQIAARFGREGTLWYQGHWGLQYYLDGAGARHTNRRGVSMAAGDHLVLPVQNTNVETNLPLETTFKPVARVDRPLSRWCATMRMNVAGFYSSDYGPLPYVFGSVGPDSYFVLRAEAPYRFEFPLGPNVVTPPASPAQDRRRSQ